MKTIVQTQNKNTPETHEDAPGSKIIITSTPTIQLELFDSLEKARWRGEFSVKYTSISTDSDQDELIGKFEKELA